MHSIEKKVKEMNEQFKKDAENGDRSKGLKVRQITQNAQKSISEFKQN